LETLPRKNNFSGELSSLQLAGICQDSSAGIWNSKQRDTTTRKHMHFILTHLVSAPSFVLFTRPRPWSPSSRSFSDINLSSLDDLWSPVFVSPNLQHPLPTCPKEDPFQPPTTTTNCGSHHGHINARTTTMEGATVDTRSKIKSLELVDPIKE
jgi:hypothetical protein